MKKIEFNREQNRYFKEMFDIRPRFEITVSSDLVDFDDNGNLKFDIDCVVVPINDFKHVSGRAEFLYEDKIKDKKQWVSYIYEMHNIGISTIDNFYLAWNKPKTTALFELEQDSYRFFIDKKMLNYRAFCEKNIKSGETAMIRINFHKDFISYGILSSEASFWMFDEYGKIWKQPFFVHRKVLYDSHLEDNKTFRNLTDVEDAIACFKDPNLW